MSDYQFLKWDTYDNGTIVRISLNRLDQRNAQNLGMLVELDEAFGRAEADDTVRVVILAGEGRMFSSGHELADRTLDMAKRIAQVPTMAALLTKESVNQTVDNMGFYNSLQACFTLHQLNHSHWVGVREDGRATAGPENGVPDWRDAPPIVLAEKNTVRADR